MLPRSLPWGEVVTKAVKDRGWAVAWLLTYGNEPGSPVTPAWEESGAWKEGLGELRGRELRGSSCERRCDPPRSRALHQALGPLAP